MSSLRLGGPRRWSPVPPVDGPLNCSGAGQGGLGRPCARPRGHRVRRRRRDRSHRSSRRHRRAEVAAAIDLTSSADSVSSTGRQHRRHLPAEHAGRLHRRHLPQGVRRQRARRAQCDSRSGLVMPDGGSIVNFASVDAFTVSPGQLIYGASKAAVVMLTKELALELAPRRIRVNAIAPGWVNTPGNAATGRMAAAAAGIPLGRVAEPEEIARWIALPGRPGRLVHDRGDRRAVRRRRHPLIHPPIYRSPLKGETPPWPTTASSARVPPACRRSTC